MIGIGRFIDEMMDVSINKRLGLVLKDEAAEDTEDTISNPKEFNKMK
jgi:hypothetical protein